MDASAKGSMFFSSGMMALEHHDVSCYGVITYKKKESISSESKVGWLLNDTLKYCLKR